MEFVIIIIIVVFVLSYNGALSTKKIYEDNKTLFALLKEKDYDFLVKARFNGAINPDDYFEKRIKQLIMVIAICLGVILLNFSWINLIIAIIITVILYKNQYSNLRSFYRKNLTAIDQSMPYYLKSIEILAQHYTIPVAISRSIETAPDIFKEGLTEMIKQIDAGDASINPYLEFAKKYPVSDSLRMMRLLYRLSIGAQENKQEQLSVFSKSVSTLQNKAREMKYQARLDKMEKKTMTMLLVTGVGTMMVMLFAMIMMMMSWT